ncbi:MAG: branched-chain amino acid ABC transporter permease [Proteobacteria bacterium]|nr:branched-chain amino acid ABC transporter permease [Pseudomonadota bacterium]
MRTRYLPWCAGAFAACALVPLFVENTFVLRVVTEALMWIGLAITWDVLGGYTGYVNFGHGAFFGIGAYTTAILMMRAGWPFLAALPVGGLAAGAVAFLAGLPTLRLRGAYFAIATWALSRAIQQLALVLDITGGPDGMRMPPFLNPVFFFYLMLGLVAGIFFTLWFLLERSPFGLKVKAIRENEEGSMALGLRPTTIKIKAFLLSATPAGILGGAFAYWITFIDPASVLGDLVTDQAVVMAVFGGLGTLVGPAIGAVLIYAFKTYFWAYLSDYQVLYLIILGVIIALSVVFLPDGLWGALTHRAARRKGGPAKASETAAPEIQEEVG